MSDMAGHAATSNQRMYAFCMRFFTDIVALGATEAVVSPGSRSTPLTLCAHQAGLRITVALDERVGGFHALGQAKVTGVPSVLICSSGTAGANYLPAIVEANHSSVPVIVCTADRPPELRQWGAGQTIDQNHLFGSNARWFHEVPVPGEVAFAHAGPLALRAFTTAVGEGGPVHLNWPMREPLEPQGVIATPSSSRLERPHEARSGPSSVLAELAARFERGLVVVGPADLGGHVAAELADFAARSGWPIIADPASGLRSGVPDAASVITTGELLFGSPAFTDTLGPVDVVVRVGLSPTSKAYRLWLQANPPEHLVLVHPAVDWSDPTDSVTQVVPGPVAGLFATDTSFQRADGSWQQVWSDAEAAASAAVSASLAAEAEAGATSELAVAAQVVDGTARLAPAQLMISNSMPVRDLDVVMRSVAGEVRVFANRGANGIDGIVATASGAAQMTGLPTVVLIGDIATVHDLGGLAAAARLGIRNLTVVVIDNDAGGIFSFLPVAQAVAPDTFTDLFTTPHGTDLAAVGRALGYDVTALASADLASTTVSDIIAGGGEPTSGGRPRLVIISTTVLGTVESMGRVRSQVAQALVAADVS